MDDHDVRAGMTNRLDRLRAAGLVERSLDPAGRRSFRIALTEQAAGSSTPRSPSTPPT
jgi:hypothetical protein